jgi:hypothetical protein
MNLHRLLCGFVWMLTWVGCGSQTPDLAPPLPPGVRLVGHIASPEIRESSGLVASRRHEGLFWTHNDHGNPNVLYAIRRDGSLIARFSVTGARLIDWEDIAADDKGFLFLGDLGNNDRSRLELAVHQIAEPDLTATDQTVAVIGSWTLRYPDAPFDCESLFVLENHGYVISKVFNDDRARIYRFPLTETTQTVVLEPVAETRITSPVTGADVSPDGSLLGIVARSGAYLYRIDGNVGRVANERPHRTRFRDHRIEGCTFVAEGLLASSETREIYLFTDPAFQPVSKPTRPRPIAP